MSDDTIGWWAVMSVHLSTVLTFLAVSSATTLVTGLLATVAVYTALLSIIFTVEHAYRRFLRTANRLGWGR